MKPKCEKCGKDFRKVIDRGEEIYLADCDCNTIKLSVNDYERIMNKISNIDRSLKKIWDRIE